MGLCFMHYNHYNAFSVMHFDFHSINIYEKLDKLFITDEIKIHAVPEVSIHGGLCVPSSVDVSGRPLLVWSATLPVILNLLISLENSIMCAMFPGQVHHNLVTVSCSSHENNFNTFFICQWHF